MAKQLSFERALGKLEEVVSRLEGEDVALEEALKLFEEGIRLSRFCHSRLEDAQARVELIVKNADGSFSSLPLAGLDGVDGPDGPEDEEEPAKRSGS